MALKEAGNAAFKAGDFPAAVRSYSAALGSSPNVSLRVLLLSNRAEVQLQLRQFEAAVCDCRAALQLDPSHEKTYSRLARAEQGLSSAPTQTAAATATVAAAGAAAGDVPIAIDEMTVRQLKAVITSAGLSFDDCTEKSDLRARAQEAVAA